jgi:general secretion pathway protein A
MLGAYVQNQKHIDRRILSRAAKEVFGTTHIPKSGGGRSWLSPAMGVAAAIVILVAIGGYMIFDHKDKFARLAGSLQSYFTAEAEPQQMDGAVTLEQSNFLNVLDAYSETDSRKNAFRALFDQWHQTYTGGGAEQPCEFAVSKGLGCLSRNGNINSLKIIDRPAVLKFLNSIGKSVYATLLGMSEEQAILAIGERQVTASLADLQSRWFGDYTVLWQLPPDYSGVIKLGSNGPDVQWLASQLAAVSGGEVSSNSMVSYDASLIREVKNFQLQEGLETDGIAGVQTLIRLNSVLQKDVPRLTQFMQNPPDKQSARAVGKQLRHTVVPTLAFTE